MTAPEVGALLRDIASTPRPTGGAAIAAARQRCASELRALGYDVREHHFEFSEFPGRFGTPLLGAAAGLAVGVAGKWGIAGLQTAPLILLLIAALALFLSGRWLAKRGVLALPLLRRRGVNLVATREGSEPSMWLCAHLDTKSQPVPTLVRSIGIVLEGIGFVLTILLSIAAVADVNVHPFYWNVAAAVTLLGALPVVLSVVGSRSPGALDNASGVASVLSAARQLAAEAGVGVLITDAEELALAGARAWANEPRRGVVLNCDGVDDAGDIHVMFTGARPTQVLDPVANASKDTGVAQHSRRLALGILTDAVAFADAGIPSVTFSRGSLRSLARVHSSRDDLKHLRGTGIADTAKLIAATARELGETR